jgi:hypothetical protein
MSDDDVAVTIITGPRDRGPRALIGTRGTPTAGAHAAPAEPEQDSSLAALCPAAILGAQYDRTLRAVRKANPEERVIAMAELRRLVLVGAALRERQRHATDERAGNRRVAPSPRSL